MVISLSSRYIDGWAQDCNNPSALAMDLLLPCTEPSLFGCSSTNFRLVLLKTPPSGFANEDSHDDVIKWKHFPRYWPFMRGIHRSPVNSPYKGQWRGALIFSLICTRINGWVYNGEAGDLRRHRAHYDVTIMHPLNNQGLPFATGRDCRGKPASSLRYRDK